MLKCNYAGLIGKFIFMFLLATVCYASITPLPVDEAFQFDVSVINPTTLNVHWRIAPNYYLYRNRMYITLEPDYVVKINYPQGEYKYTADNQRFEALSGNINVPVIMKEGVSNVKVRVKYQGCSSDGFCYPPQKQEVKVIMASQIVIPYENVTPRQQLALLSDQNKVTNVLHTESHSISWLIFLFLGLLLAFTPCVLPMIPILTGLIVGQKNSNSMGKAFILSSIYVLGSALTYALAGVAAAWFGSSLQVWLQQPWVIALSSSIFILLALSLFEVYHLRLPRSLQHLLHRLTSSPKGGTYVGVFAMGVLSTLVVSPCITAPLVGVLIYISQTGDMWFGASALFAIGIGMGIPLILIGISAGKWLPKSGPWMKIVKDLFGIMMLAMAVWLLTRMFPPHVNLLLWSALCVGCVIYFLMHLREQLWLNHLTYPLAVIAVLTAVGVIVTNDFHLQPPQMLTASSNQTFVTVKDLTDLQSQLILAKARHMPVLVDFYADWCESCVTMEKEVFQAPLVQSSLNNFILLRIDLSQNTPMDEAIMKKFGVVAPPTILFFTNEGQEVISRRIVGDLSAKDFILRVNKFMTANCDKTVTC